MNEIAVCPACAERNPARAKFCVTCGARMTADAGERRVVTVVFADLSGFTSYSEGAAPEEVRTLADEAAVRLGDIVRRYGGTVDKVIGDCVMAVFGAPVGHEDDPERAVRCALDMQACVEENPDAFAGLPLRIGIFTGEAMYAPVGPQGEYTVLGDTVNTSARLQSAAPRSGILVGEATARAVGASVELEEVEAISAKGKQEPVPAWRVAGLKMERAKPAASRAPLIGRETELGLLGELWQRVEEHRRPALATLIGQPGIGKTRLISAFTEQAGSALWGRCVPYGEGITYWPVVEIIREAAGITHDDDPDEVSLKLGALLERLGSEDVDQLRTMAVAIGNLVAMPRTPRGTYSTAEISKAELHWGVRRIFELLSLTKPFVLVFEDLHWAEPTLLELIASLLETEEEAPYLVIASARPEFAETAPALLEQADDRTGIFVDALGQEDSRALLAGLIGPEAVESDRSLAHVLEAAAGNPLYLEETVRMLVETGVIDEEGRPTGRAVDTVDVPDSLIGLINSRLDRISALERAVAGNAAVVGTTFWTGAVRAIDDAPADVERGVEELAWRDFVRENPRSLIAEEREFVFKHVLLRDVAYGRLPKARRAALHERCSQWIAALPGSGDEYIEFIAMHLLQSCLLAKEVGRSAAAPPILAAVRALMRAGKRAESREGTREADRFYARALELLEDGYPETAIELRLRRAELQAVLGNMLPAAEQVEAVAEEGRSIGRLDTACMALLNLASFDLAAGRPADAHERLAEAERLADVLDDRPLRVRVGYVLASIRALYDRDPERAVEDLLPILEIAARLEDPKTFAEGHLRLGTIYFNMGRLEDAERAFERCRTIAADLGSLRLEAGATYMLGAVRFYRGPREEAERLFLQAASWLRRTADWLMQTQTMRRLGMLALARGDLSLADKRLREAIPLARRAPGQTAVEIHRGLAEALARQGRIPEAREAVEAARENVPEGLGYSEAAALIGEGAVAAEEGDAARTHAAFDRAIELLEEARLPFDLGDARITYADALRVLDQTEPAVEQLRLARETFAPLGADATVDIIDRDLAEIEGAGRADPLSAS